MGNLVAFRQDSDPALREAASNDPAIAPDNTGWLEPLNPEFVQHGRGEQLGSLAVFRRYGRARTVHGSSGPTAFPDLDGYMLVLLADQEFTAGRDMQAQTLVDAAYAAFDRAEPSQLDRAANL